MPQQAWTEKRERQYEHIKDGLLDRGEDEDTAEEIAARGQQGTGLQRRGQESSRSPTDDLLGRGGLRSLGPAAAPTTSSTTRPGTRASRAARR